MRLIDIDAFRKDHGLAERCQDCERDKWECSYDQIYTRMFFCGWLDDEPIIEIVRCGECKKYQRDVVFGTGYCGGFFRDPEDFCSRGEKSEAESE